MSMSTIAGASMTASAAASSSPSPASRADGRTGGRLSRRASMRSARPGNSGTRGWSDSSVARVRATASDTASIAPTPSAVAGWPLASRRRT